MLSGKTDPGYAPAAAGRCQIASEEDGRVTYITVTKKGSELSQKYDEQYFDSLLPYMEEIPDEDAECMIQTIEKFYQIMCERRKHYDER